MQFSGILLALALGFGLATGPVAEAQGQKVQVGSETNLPLPRYVSLRGGKVNVRRGPGLEYRIDWVFQRAGLPVQVIDEYGNWRRIADSDNAGGWVYHSLLTGRRTVLITEPDVTFRADPDDSAPATAHAEQGVVARLLQCAHGWCEVQAEGATGWLRKGAIWGVAASEVFED